MIVIAIIYVVSFPIMLIFGLKLLRMIKISSTQFLLACIVPLPFLILWILSKRQLIVPNKVTMVKSNYTDGKITSDESPTVPSEILNSFQRAYKISGMGSEYWESIIVFRRLLLGATALIPNSIIQMSCCALLCIIFQSHHFVVKPFINTNFNKAESFSLIMLCLVSVINLFKSVYIQMGVIPDGPDVNILGSFTFAESLFILLLVGFVILLEITAEIKSRKK